MKGIIQTMMNKKYKVLALFGESGNGKDYIQRELIRLFPDQTKGIVSCTTRPRRDYEVDGKDYYFMTVSVFGEKVLNGTMLEATCFNDWFYGTAIEELECNKINIGVFNVEGIRCLISDSRLDVIPIYITASPKTRLMRALKREDNPDCHEICRRFLADEQDFADLDFDYIIFDNDAYAGDITKLFNFIN